MKIFLKRQNYFNVMDKSDNNVPVLKKLVNWALILFLPACFFLSFLTEGMRTSSSMHYYFTPFTHLGPDSNTFFGCYADNTTSQNIKNYKLIQKKSRGEKRRQGKLCCSNHLNPPLPRRTENIPSLLQSLKSNSCSN